MYKWDWRTLRINSAIRRGIRFPRRERLLVRKALENLGLRYKEIVPIYNPAWKGNTGSYPDGYVQWYDFFYLMPNGHMACLLFDLNYPTHGGVKPRERLAFNAKKAFLSERKIPCLVVPRIWSSSEYEVTIKMFSRRYK